MADAAPTPYDRNAYPTAIFAQTAPDRLATIARIAGLTPPDIRTARVLEIGAGDGMNLLALAVAYPGARFTGFDLAASAVERGRRWCDAAGLGNVGLRTLDILDAGDALERPFDYIIAHGVYAWVPPHVRDAAMALIGRLLSPDGVAFVSYNAMPGGYLRLALRDALRFAVEGLEGDERQQAVREHLAVLAEAPDGPENPAQAAFRDAAKHTLDKPWSILGHDELGDDYHPQALSDVVAAAAAQGLRFLGDADRERMADAFLPDDVAAEAGVEAQLVRLRQAQDYRDFRFFRQTLLVRAACVPRRRPDQAAIAGLYAATRAVRDGSGAFRIDNNVFEIADAGLAAALRRLVETYPARVRVTELVDDDARRSALFEMFDAGLIELSTVPAPMATVAGERPLVSPLVRAMIADDLPLVCRLDHRLLAIPDAGPRHLMRHLDGTRDRAALADIAAAAGLDGAEALERALATLAREGVLLP